MKIAMPVKVNQIIKSLMANGYEAYAVGGCVRDSILGREPDDWDITTSARPEQVKEIFSRTIDTGIQHGTVTVMLDHEGFEVTTYRIDGEYEDHRRPKGVEFTALLAEDLRRRDFTINAMAYNDEEGVVDIFGGVEDLERKLIRCVGEPEERFMEDALRILRAVRFSAQLGFRIEERTKEVIRKLAPTLKDISAERIQVELVKTLVSGQPERMKEARELGITAVILPEYDALAGVVQNNPHHSHDVEEHTLKALENVEADKVLRLTMLLHDIGKPAMRTTDGKGIDHFKRHEALGEKMAHDILRRLKFDNDTIRKVTGLIRFHDYRIAADSRSVRRAMNKIGEELFPLYEKVRRADTLAQSDYRREEKLKNLDEIEAVRKEIQEKKECYSLKDLAVTGRDLIAAGVPQGKEVGECLNRLLNIVLDSPEKNSKESLLEIIEKEKGQPN